MVGGILKLLLSRSLDLLVVEGGRINHCMWKLTQSCRFLFLVLAEQGKGYDQ